MPITIEDFPPETFHNILSYLDIRSYQAVRHTNKRFREFACQEPTEKLHITRVIKEQILRLERGGAYYYGYLDDEIINNNEFPTGITNLVEPTDQDSTTYQLSDPSLDNQLSQSFNKKGYLDLSRELFIGLEIYPVHKIITPIVPNPLTVNITEEEGHEMVNYPNRKEFNSPDGTRYVLISLAYSINVEPYYQISIYDLTGNSPKLETLSQLPEGMPRRLSISSDNRYIAIQVGSGYVVVYDRWDIKSKTYSVNKIGRKIFSSIYPSVIKKVQVSAGGEILFLRFSRLGGLLLVNLDTREEMDVGHYRLDLDLSVYHSDRVLTVASNMAETVVFGRATTITTEQRPRILWDYYKFLVSKEISTCVPLFNATPLSTKNLFVGSMGSLEWFGLAQDPDYSDLVLSFESFLNQSENTFSDDDGETAAGEINEENDVPNTQTPDVNSANGHVDDADNSDSDSDDNDPSAPSIARLSAINTTNHTVWCVSPDTTRLALVRNIRNPLTSINIISLHPEILRKVQFNPNERFTDADIQFRTIINEEQQPISSIVFIDRDRLLVRYETTIVIYKIGPVIQPCGFSKIEPNGTVTFIR